MKKKKFRIAKEGATTDGRKISREWLQQMAAQYNPAVYGARINIEHIKGLSPESTFRAYGDVVALATEEENGTMYLLAELAPTDELKALTKAGQKVFTSMEVDPSFADTGAAYLVGLAVTDSPASLGTEMLEFSSQRGGAVFASRKLTPHNIFTEAFDAELDFSEQKPSLADSIKALFKKADEKANHQNNDYSVAITLLATTISDLKTEFSAFKAGQNTQERTDNDENSELTALQKQFNELKEKLEKTPANMFKRPPSGGGDNSVLTDC